MSFNGAVAKLGGFMLTLALAFHPSESYATYGLTATGTVAEIRNNSSWTYESAIFITGVASLGTCLTNATDAGATLVVLRLKGDTQGRMQQRVAFAAQLSGKAVTVIVDDNTVDPVTGQCYVRSIHTSS